MSTLRQRRTMPAPSHRRHAAPSAPWPWINIHDDIDTGQLETESSTVPDECTHANCECWNNYPKSLFPNWTPSQVVRSKISDAIDNKDHTCKIYYIDVSNQGLFTNPGINVAEKGQERESWNRMIGVVRPGDLRVKVLFLENLSGPILQMLGARYNIEPFFWSSSLNWIPSWYQENPVLGKGDHITIALTFLKSMDPTAQSTESFVSIAPTGNLNTSSQIIDTQAPLQLQDKQLVLDLLSVHLIRNKEDSTIISYHPNMQNHPVTKARYLRDRIRYAGQSVYWQMIFRKSPDPTFVLLTFVWHTVYAWDEALEHLYGYICWLETQVISTNDMLITHQLHLIRAHHLHYSSLLENLQNTVEFIKKTRNPAMESVSETERDHSATLLSRECDKLLEEINRLENECKMQDRRLKNVMNLAFSSVNIEMARAAVKDSAAVRYNLVYTSSYSNFQQMKAIAYLTMIFLPASFVAAVFGMNIQTFDTKTNGTLAQYLEVALPLTILTIWVVVAVISKHIYPGSSFLIRFAWPIKLSLASIENKADKRFNKENILPLTIQDSVARDLEC